MKKSNLIILIISIIVISIFSFGIEIGNIRIGTVSDFNDTYHKDIENTSFYKDYYNTDKLIVFNLWATWCKPCIIEMPKLNTLKEKYKKNDKIAFLSMSLDNDSIKLQKFINKKLFKFKDITFENISHRDTILAKIQNKNMSIIKSNTIPKTILIKNKKTIKIFVGNLDDKDFNKIDSIINVYK